MREKLPLFIAIIFALIALGGIYTWLQSQQQQAEPMVQILVAARRIQEGDIIQSGQVTTREIPRSQFVEGMFRGADQGNVVKQTAAVSVAEGEALFRSMIEVPREFVPDLTPLIETGLRAISIPVGDIASVSQLVKPGDHVDVLVNYEIPYIRETEVEVPNTGRFKVGQKETEPATIYLLQDVVVLAVGRTILSEERYSDPSNRGYRGVTLAVTPVEARALAFANKNANEGYTLTLRSPEDSGILEDYKVASYKTVLDIANLRELLEVQHEQRAEVIYGGREQDQ